MSFPLHKILSLSPWAGLTTVGVAPLLQVGVAVQAAVSRRDVLRGTGDGCFGHNRVWIWWLVHGLELQPLVVNPKIRWFQVLGVALVFVWAVWGLGGSPLPAGESAQALMKNWAHLQGEGGKWQSTRKRRRWKELSCRKATAWLSLLLFLVGRRAPCAQEDPHQHHKDDEGAHWDDDDDNDQDETFTVASYPWFTSRGERLSETGCIHKYAVKDTCESLTQDHARINSNKNTDIKLQISKKEPSEKRNAIFFFSIYIGQQETPSDHDGVWLFS